LAKARRSSMRNGRAQWKSHAGSRRCRSKPIPGTSGGCRRISASRRRGA
jgi:hypothetical protein